MMINCPMPMPEVVIAFANPVRPGKRRLTMTPTGAMEAMPLPMAKITP